MYLKFFLKPIGIAGLFFFTSAASAERANCSTISKLPALFEGCQGEACGILRYSKAIQDVTLFSKPNLSSERIDSIKKCQNLDGFKAFTLLKKLGEAEVIEPTVSAELMGIKKGQRLPLIFNVGEGYFQGCFKGQKIEIVTSEKAETNAIAAKVLAFPEGETWISLKGPKGKVGYAKDASFYMGFYEYEPRRFCPEDHPFGKQHQKIEKEVSERLSSAFEISCKTIKNCDNKSDPTLPCEQETKIWGSLVSTFPKNLQCAAFYIGKQACSESWQGGFSCAFKYDGSDQNIDFRYSCSRNEKTSCILN